MQAGLLRMSHVRRNSRKGDNEQRHGDGREFDTVMGEVHQEYLPDGFPWGMEEKIARM